MQTLTMIEFSTDEDFEIAQKWCARMGYRDSYAYATSSALPGMYCVPIHKYQKTKVIVKTIELGFCVIETLED